MSKQSKVDLTKQDKHKEIAREYFELLKLGKYKEGLKFFSPDCITHNPYISGSVQKLTDAMIEASKGLNAQSTEPEFSVKHVLADGNFVAVHTEFLNSKSKPSEGGLRQVHLLRFENKKIVEYWDITQQILPNMPNVNGAF